MTLCIIVGTMGCLSAPALALPSPNGDVKIIVIHTNDVHSRVESEAYVSSLVKQKKAEGSNVLVLSAGDVLHGQPVATLSRGKNVVDVMNAVGYDAMAPGNHDFNYGSDQLEALESLMNFPVLAANVENLWTRHEFYKPYITKEFDGVKVGIMGLATPETVTNTNPENVEHLRFSNPVETADATVRDMMLAECDVIIALAHLGMDEGTKFSERSIAVAQMGGVDLIIDGHSHHALPEGEVVGKTMIAQAGSYGEYIGMVELTVSKDGSISKQASLIPIPAADAPNPELPADPEIVGIIEELNKGIVSFTSQVIAHTPVGLEGERETIRTQETNLGNLICDAMLYETGADIAVMNGGGIRASLPAGDITKGDVLTVLPFSNYIVVKRVSGDAVMAALERGVSSYPAPAGGFPQVGGISFTFNAGRPAGSRIASATLRNGEPIDPGKTYLVATNDYIAAGGDGYEMLNTSGGVSYSALDEALIAYLQTGPAVGAGAQGRIVTGSQAVAA